MKGSLKIDDARSYLDHVSPHEYFAVSVDFELQSGWAADEFTLADFEMERRPTAHGHEPGTEIRARGSGRRVFENRAVVGEEKPAQDFLPAHRREHVGLASATHALEP